MDLEANREATRTFIRHCNKCPACRSVINGDFRAGVKAASLAGYCPIGKVLVTKARKRVTLR